MYNSYAMYAAPNVELSVICRMIAWMVQHLCERKNFLMPLRIIWKMTKTAFLFIYLHYRLEEKNILFSYLSDW